MDPTDAQTACFEAGVKFGSLYHQFAGTPVSPESAPTLERAIEDAIENQPYCERVTVDILTDELRAAIDDTSAEYTELTGRFMAVELVVDHEGQTVVATMETVEGYPLMAVQSVEG
ncbi:hypothetical protein BRC64_12200 [Halobacteriales archaeon QH_10_67_22]|nr:MAG: hypothetical protein BRC64_12200 [Halobacteriales archaeon QH_10_67_22]